MSPGQNVFHSITTPLDSNEPKFFLTELNGTEEVSNLFCYNAILTTEDNNVDFSLLMGKSVTLNINIEVEKKRYINGIISGFSQEETGDTTSRFQAEIRPWPWFLTLTKDCRIFQDKTAPEIIETLLKEYAFSNFKANLTGTYTKREYSVQYRESVFDYISRLMEEEGIFYLFEHYASGHKMILADDSGVFKPCPELAVAEPAPVDYQHEREGYITRCSLRQRVTANTYSLDDFNFETPSSELKVKADGKISGDLKVYDYPGGYQKTSDGESLVKKRIEEREFPGKAIDGDSHVRSFIAGYKFTLQKHKRKDLNASYVIRRLSISATQDQYGNTFEAFPETVNYRPPLVTPKPSVYGLQTAIVVGKSGEEIWTDKYGRVKVQFHWDQLGKKDENSSCWVRVAQDWAGKNFGSMFIPRIGQEVVIGFIDGDPDRPIITGSVYNSEQTTPISLPADQTQSMIKTNSSKGGGGFNQVRLEDKKGSEEIYMHAQKDMNVDVENDLNINVKKNNETHTVKGTRDVTVTGAEKHTNKADFTQKVTGNYTLKVTGNLTIEASGITVVKGSMVKIN